MQFFEISGFENFELEDSSSSKKFQKCSCFEAKQGLNNSTTLGKKYSKTDISTTFIWEL